MTKLNILCALAFGAIISNSLAEMPGSPSPAIAFESGENQTTLIELFTSEGCSSCPPADAWLRKLRNNPGLWKSVVPIEFHVDYWNRLGWTDRFSRPEFTDRQRRYAAAWRIDSVYTPNFVVNGREWRDWFNGEAPQTKGDTVGKLRITLNGKDEVKGRFEGAQPGPVELEVALLGADLESNVKGGENSGRKLRHDFVVLDLAKIGMTRDSNHWIATLPLPKTLDKARAIAAWVTSADGTPPIQTTGGWVRF